MIENNWPSYHITAWKNWINDPNGLVYYQGKYHAFYQHHPYEHKWGPMHWGHVISDDLYHWEHLPIALYPDENGTCFSGSAIVDHDNVSGLGKDGIAPLLLFYTADLNGESESQCIAYSLDGVNFEKYEGNPILEHSKYKDFRDPKVFYYEADNAWKMIISVFDHIKIFESKNLLDWNLINTFSTKSVINGVWECPDLFPLQFNDETYWVLILSVGPKPGEGSTRTQYFIGDFDGKNFTPLESSDSIRFIDYGLDNYAITSFSETDERIMITWAQNGYYAPATPQYGYCGQLSAPRIPFLFEDNSGNLSLGFRPVDLPETINSSELETHSSEGKMYVELSNKPLLIEFDLDSDANFELELYNDSGETLSFSKEGTELILDRSETLGNIDHEAFQHDFFKIHKADQKLNAPSNYFVFLDSHLLEIYAENGTNVFTSTIYPKSPLDKAKISENTKAKFIELDRFKPAISVENLAKMNLKEDE